MKESSSVKPVNAPVERVYATLSDLNNMRPLIEKALNNETLREKLLEAGKVDVLDCLQDVTLTTDSIEVPAPMIGTISMHIIEREENKCIKFETDKSPVNAKLWIQVLPETESTSKLKLTIDADIPFMLKAMVGSKLRDGIEKVADAIAMIQY